MANLFVNLPLPALNGAGAAVATDGMGRDKTIVSDGSFEGATVQVEVSVDGGTTFAPIAVLQSGANKQVIPVAADLMRVFVSGRKAAVPFSANIDVGANDNGALFIAVPLPALNGAGASVAASTLGSFSTFIVGGSFAGASVQVQASEDGTDWAVCAQFSGAGGITSKDVIANFYRAFVSGRKSAVPFTATIAVGSINDPITTGGGGTPVIEDEGVPLAGAPHTTLNFVGAGVAAADAGAGVATITVPGAATPAVIFDDAVPADEVNIRSDRATDQGTIDNTRVGITQFGSLGTVSEDYATVGGGVSNSALGAASCVPGGDGNEATSVNSIATGRLAQALREGQRAHSSGDPITGLTVGQAQESVVTMLGETPGLAGEETVELALGDGGSFLELENDKGYAISVLAVARGDVLAAVNVQVFKQLWAVRRTAGTTVIAGSGTLEQVGDAASAGWSLNASVAAGPDRFRLVFSPGATTSAARCIAKVTIVEIYNP